MFNEERKRKTEIFNDYNSELNNLYRCMKYHAGELKKELQYMLNSRELFQDFWEQYRIRRLTDIQRATRYFMIIKMSYGAKLTAFGCVKRNVENMTLMFEKIQKRLNTVVIENEDFKKSYNSRIKKQRFLFGSTLFWDRKIL